MSMDGLRKMVAMIFIVSFVMSWLCICSLLGTSIREMRVNDLEGRIKLLEKHEGNVSQSFVELHSELDNSLNKVMPACLKGVSKIR